MYKNYVVSLRKSSDCKKNLKEKLGNTSAEINYLGKIATSTKFEQGYPTKIK